MRMPDKRTLTYAPRAFVALDSYVETALNCVPDTIAAGCQDDHRRLKRRGDDLHISSQRDRSGLVGVLFTRSMC